MNRYPVWKYLIIGLAMLLGLIYTTPNFFGEAPAVQVSSAKATIKVDDALRVKVEAILKSAGVENTGLFIDANSIKTRFRDTDTQLKAKDILDAALNPDKKKPIPRIATSPTRSRSTCCRTRRNG